MKTSYFALAAIGFVALTAARELGLFSLSINTSRCQRNFEGTHHEADPNPPHETAWTVRIVDATRQEVPPFAPMGGNVPVATYTGAIDKLDIDGWYWLPLYKTGTCDWQARVLRNDEQIGEMNGHLELVVKGPCSVYEFRAKLHEAVEDDLRKYVDDTVRK